MSAAVREADGEAGAQAARASPYYPHRGLIPVDRVRELSELRPIRAMTEMAWCWTGILAAWTVAALWTHWWVVALAIPVVGTRFYALFIIGHDGMHRRLCRRAKVNDLVADVFIFAPIGAIVRLNKANHLEHHRHLAREDDPDRHKYSCFGKETGPRLATFLSGLASLLPVLSNVFRKSHGPRGQRRYTGRDIAVLLGAQSTLVGGLTLAFGWWGYPLMWLVPVYVHMYLGDLIRSFLEHAHPTSDAEADEHRLVTHRSNRLERLIIAPKNMNLHTAHHLWPSIPYYNLPAADRELRERFRGHELEWRGSYLSSLVGHLRALPNSSCESAAAAT